MNGANEILAITLAATGAGFVRPVAMRQQASAARAARGRDRVDNATRSGEKR